jgi:hypothetical protein
MAKGEEMAKGKKILVALILCHSNSKPYPFRGTSKTLTAQEGSCISTKERKTKNAKSLFASQPLLNQCRAR